MGATIYKRTATRSKSGEAFALGRATELDGRSPSQGGYVVFKLCKNYDGRARDGIAKTWRAVKDRLTYEEAVALMNRRCGFKAFET